MKRPILDEDNNDLLYQVTYTLDLEKYADYLEEQNGVINWVAVKDKLPKEGKYKIDYINWGIHGVMCCAINSEAWKWNKPTHWAEIKSPNHS